MKPIFWVLLISFSLTSVQSQENTDAFVRRIGIYDSRSVAIAFVGSDVFNRWMAPVYEELKQAKADNDQAAIRRLEKTGRARQNQLHMQGFSTTSFRRRPSGRSSP